MNNRLPLKSGGTNKNVLSVIFTYYVRIVMGFDIMKGYMCED